MILVVSIAVSLLLNVFQSAEVNAPVLVVPERSRDNTWDDRLKPLVVPKVASPVLVPEMPEVHSWRCACTIRRQKRPYRIAREGYSGIDARAEFYISRSTRQQE